MTDQKKLKEAFEKAASIAEVVPESMQDAAFHRALDEILGGSAVETRRGHKQPRSAPRSGRPEPSTQSGGSPVDLLNQIDRTQHPDINETMSVLDRSLSVLLIAKDLGVDGLSAPKIAEVLTDKFRVKTRRQHVNQQLDAALKLVDREKQGRGVIYKLMAAGETHLTTGGTGVKSSSRRPKASTSRRKRKAPSTAKAAKAKATDKKVSRKRSGGRPGPKVAIKSLIEAGYFKKARTIGDIQDRLNTKVGHRYKATDLSPALGRLLRDGELDRDRNESGQYEYGSKKS